MDAKMLDGKVAIITGASYGMGRTMAELFAEEGASVVITSRGKEKLDEVVNAINDKGGRAVVFEAKYTHSAQMEQSRVTREQAARLDDHLAAGAMCFVVAGFGSGDVFRIPWEVWRDMKMHFGHKYATPEELEAYKVPLGRNGVLLLLD